MLFNGATPAAHSQDAERQGLRLTRRHWTGLKEFLDSGNAEGVDPKAYQVLDMVLEYRQLTKLKSTYVDALPTLVNPNAGRIHTEFKQTGSDTGRLSSTEPNVQNIPVRTELGRRVRSAFVAEDEALDASCSGLLAD